MSRTGDTAMPELDAALARPKYVGRSVPRGEDPRLLAGRGRFVDDLRPGGLLHVAFRRSDHAHAAIVAIDLAAARAMPGVIAVYTAEDCAAIRPVLASSRIPGYYATPILALARDKVRHVGEAVVAIIADSRYRAEDAAEKVEIVYRPLPPLVDPDRAAEERQTLLHEAAGSNVLLQRRFARGEPDAELATAALRVGGRFRMHRKAPSAIENRACLAEYDLGREQLTLWSTTQIPGVLRNALAEAFDMPGHDVRVVAPDVGGGFGGKGTVSGEELVVCFAARSLGRPVKWTGDRIEELLSATQAFDQRIEAELGVDGEGRLLALTARATGDVGAYSVYPWTAALEPVQVVSFLPGPYRLAHYCGEVRAVATCKAPTGAYRGVGRPIAAFVMERLIDKAARRLGIDPREMRRRNLLTTGEFPYKVASGLVWDRSGFLECLEAACNAIGYEALRAQQREARAAGRWFGIGIASYAELTGLGSRISVAPGMPLQTGSETAILTLDAAGGLSAAFGIAGHGQGLETTLAQIIADRLGVAPGDVRIVHGDSAAVSNATGTFASRSTVLAGGAAIRAAEALRQKVLAVAAHLLEAAPEQLRAEDGRIWLPGSNRATGFREVAAAVYREMGRLPPELRQELTASASYDPVFGTTSSATHVVAVEIDPASFKVAVLKYVVAEDCGRLINPAIVDGQVQGGVAQGIGAALHEEVVYDRAGQLLSGSFVDYLLPTAVEVPPLEVLHIESEAPTLGGFRGMGEGGTIGAPAALANAISDALAPLGIEIDELPATPERLFRLVEAARGKDQD